MKKFFIFALALMGASSMLTSCMDETIYCHYSDVKAVHYTTDMEGRVTGYYATIVMEGDSIYPEIDESTYDYCTSANTRPTDKVRFVYTSHGYHIMPDYSGVTTVSLN